METYGKILLIAVPAFLALVIFEKLIDLFSGRGYVPTMDMLSSLSSGITNILKDVLGLSVAILSYEWLVTHLAISELKGGPWALVLVFLVLDFQGYWVHRWAHEINFFWNKHAIHHSSEEFNLACALRQSLAEFVQLFTFFLLPCALMGVEAKVIAIVAPIQLFAQFWYHTRYIDRMGWLENIIVTPSHHRVHHAINPEYMDKNYGQIFIFWDRWFGTFQEEMKQVTPVYGIKRQANTWNPIRINFQHIWLMLKDAIRTNDWSEKFKLWWMPTGYRPSDMIDKYPVAAIDEVYSQTKWQTVEDLMMKSWIWFHLLGLLVLVLYLFARISEIGSPGIFWYGGFLIFHIYAYTDLMDINFGTVIVSLLEIFLLFFLVNQGNGWFGLDASILNGTWWVIGWVLLTSVGNIILYFWYKNVYIGRTKNLAL